MNALHRGRWRAAFWLLASGLALLAALRPAPAAAQVDIVWTPKVEVRFPDGVLITVPVPESLALRRLTVHLRPNASTQTYVGEMRIQNGIARYVHDARAKPLPLFGLIYYWFEGETETGEHFTSASFTFIYEDNRFTWHRLDQPPLQVFWYQNDASVGEAALNAGHIALQRAFVQWQGVWPPERTIRIYVYATYQDWQTAIQYAPNWSGGHADPAQAVVLVYGGMTPESRVELQRKVAHEVAHIVLYENMNRLVGPGGYERLPWWLVEGIPSLAEPYPHPEYYLLLDEAAQQNRLIPLAELCNAQDVLGHDEAYVRLAYAEAASVTTHIHGRYGPAGLQSLLQAYGMGASCQDGPRQALGLSLNELEEEWRQAWDLYPKRDMGLLWATGIMAVVVSLPLLLMLVLRWLAPPALPPADVDMDADWAALPTD
ncbi:MAG: hypothetical protein GXO54_05190 [Chloroflexi bacterium]|nr:hypothetical protein [Chloroflexota bacterium]